MYKKNIYYSIYYSIIGDIIGFDNYKLITESRNINNNNQAQRLSNQTINSIIEFILLLLEVTLSLSPVYR